MRDRDDALLAWPAGGVSRREFVQCTSAGCLLLAARPACRHRAGRAGAAPSLHRVRCARCCCEAARPGPTRGVHQHRDQPLRELRGRPGFGARVRHLGDAVRDARPRRRRLRRLRDREVLSAGRERRAGRRRAAALRGLPLARPRGAGAAAPGDGGRLAARRPRRARLHQPAARAALQTRRPRADLQLRRVRCLARGGCAAAAGAPPAHRPLARGAGAHATPSTTSTTRPT